MKKEDTVDQILDLLLDLLDERRERRSEPIEFDEEAVVDDVLPEDVQKIVWEAGQRELLDVIDADVQPIPKFEEPKIEVEPEKESDSAVDVDVIESPLPLVSEREFELIEEPLLPPETIHMNRTIGRLFVGLLGFIVLANIPFFNFAQINKVVSSVGDGTQRIRFARDGLLLRGSGPGVFIIEDNTRHWITTSEAFEFYGHRWRSIRQVSDAYLEEFPEGDPIYVLLKCPTSPHIYALAVSHRGSQTRIKRWIEDIPTFEALGFEWEQVEEVSCNYLRSLPQGDPFTDISGSPPQP